MIKHRFILRGEDDFRIFAAIPVERPVIMWKPYEPQLANAEAHALCVDILATEMEYAAALAVLHETISRNLRFLAQRCAEVLATLDSNTLDQSKPVIAEFAHQETLVGHVEMNALNLVATTKKFMEQIETLTPAQCASALITRLARERLEGKADRAEAVAVIFDRIKNLATSVLRFMTAQNATGGSATLRTYCHALVVQTQQAVDALGRCAYVAKIESVLAKITPQCPPGVPFASYTIECAGHRPVAVVEGCAWGAADSAMTPATDTQPAGVVGGQHFSVLPVGAPVAVCTLTDEEKRVVEIVSQMLTERALNPKADTRIPVVPVDPAHERHVRAVEDRDATTPPTETRLRTIKFTVSPPRYLRAAAERILASPRKAHWVVGHWRDQPYGTAHQLRRRTWIKPHIRGLGEAGAITAKIAAPDEKAAATHTDDRKPN